jgi:hypothetical protein
MSTATQERTRQVQRIDGRRYVVGSKDHAQAMERATKRVTIGLHRHGVSDRLDANEVAFLARQLVFMSSAVQKTLFDKLRMLEIVPITHQVPAGADAWGYEQETEVGEALIGANLQADDHPQVDLAAEEFVFPLLNVTASYQYDVGELERAAQARRNLSARKAQACADAIARGLNRVAMVGKPALGIYGLYNNPNVPEITLTNGEWLTATADEILADLAQIEQAAITNSRDNYQFATLRLPTAYEARLRALRIGADQSPSVWQYFFGTPGAPGIGRMLRTVERDIALDELTGSDIGVDDPPMGLAYSASPDVVSMDIPIAYREEPAQARNFKFIVPARARTTGVIWHQPTAGLYIKNLD